MKIVMISKSEGNRGQSGKKKVYEISITNNTVTVSWGMAEKPARQTSTKSFANGFQASLFATDKQYEKLAKGYEIAYTA
jgi:predicted DNA-binding WGR domain protein